MSKERQSVGIIGTGLMGSACAKRLLGAGFEVVGYDVDAARLARFEQSGGRAAGSIEDVARSCRKVVLAVFNTDQVEEVIEGRQGLLSVLPRGAPSLIAMCVSTCDPDRIAALVARIPAGRLQYIDSPISGTSAQTESGDGLGLIGGDSAAVDAARDILDAICPRRRHLGAAGNGSRAKLAINLILGVNRAALAEGLVFVERMGLAPEAFLAVARESAAYSQVMDIKGAKMVTGDFAPHGFVAQSLKDFSLMAEQAQRIGQRLPLAETDTDLMKGCVAHGESEWDNAAVIQEIRRRRSKA